MFSRGNAAPNYVNYTDMREPFALNPAPSAALGRVVGRAQVSKEQLINNAPYINGQTYAGNANVIQAPQGYFRKFG